MREILFRGKRLDNGEWVQGYYVNCFGPGCGPNETRHYIEEYPGAWYEVYPSTVGQYTGLTDKNGKRIFEGDVVSIPIFGYNSGKRMLLEVRWHEAWLKWVVTNEKDTPGYFFEDLSEYDYDEMEVTGNIHDNPELLGGADDV